MIIVHGVYHFRPRRVGFRNDYCLWCRRERRSILVRTFDAWHILWIPILPLGLLKRWYCTVCGREPHVLPGPRRSLQRAGLLALLMISILVWKVPAEPDDVLALWAFRVGAPVGAVLVLRHLLRTPKDPSLNQLLADIVPANDITCLFCATPLIAGSRWSCPNCCAVRY
jgi:hypothetical protein